LTAGSSSKASCSLCPAGQFQNASGQTDCLRCRPGAFAASTATAECALCSAMGDEEGNVFFNTHPGSGRCWPCPANAQCKPDSITNKEGYAILDAASCTTGRCVYRCPHDQGRVCLPFGRCHKDPVTGETASEGPLCGACRQNYGRSRYGMGRCERCPSTVQMFFGILFNLLWLLFLVACLASFTLNQDNKKPK